MNLAIRAKAEKISGITITLAAQSAQLRRRKPPIHLLKSGS
jgi:hypothetical protein